ncbi:hypothetical protein M9Y10_004003 [Tritrichomonas musculus]|uniref:Uncharacterized protein n=1 Tax=Tritrichomonas musculus TaxID=1915356 RepID=A0ABR2JQT2_9EUKA
MTQSSSGWTQSGDNLYSEVEGSTITVEVPCSQFWVSGTVDPNYGNIDIIVDDEYESTVSLYQETHEANINFYESPKYLSNKKRKIILKNEGNRPVSIYRIYYNAFPYFDKPVNNVDGLINITCDQFTYEGGWVKCHDNERWADIGSYTNDAGGKISYKFTGSRVHAFSLRQNRDGEKRCNAKFFIDNKEICEINLFPTTTHHQVVFSSDYLPFGEHTIEIAHGEVSGGPIIFCSFYVDPLPKIGGEKLGYNDIKGNDKSDNWEYKNEENKTPYFTTTNINAFVIFKFHGTRFWLTGIRDSTYGKFDLIIDEESHIEIDETKGISNFAYPERAYNNAILLYESDVLQLKDHTVKIVNKDNKRITIINLLYSTQPHNAILIPAEEIKFDENWNKEDDGGYSTTKDNSIAEINKYFNQFWIIGNKTPKQGKMNIYYNDEYQLDINPPEIETIFDKEILFYELKNIKHNSYDLKIKKTSTSGDINTEESLHINYCYYLNEKSFTIPSETITIETSGMTQSSSGWTQSGDNLYSEVEGSTITVEVPCSQFWVSGTVDPNYGNIDIIVDDEYESTVSLYQETHEANINFYESPKYLSNKKRKIILKNEGNRPVSIYRIYYNAFPYFDKPVNNVDGLINITCDQFTYEGGWVKCHDNERWADIGSYTNDAGGKISYKFTGSRVHAFSLRQNRDGEKRCNAKFFIDNKEICEINLFPTTTHHQVVFSSDYLPFGEHTIEIAHGEVSGGPIIFCSFYVDPLPKIGGEKLGYNDIKGNDKSDNWEYKNEENKTPYFTTTNINAFVIFKFHGTRFWLTGIRDSTYGKFDLIIDEESHIEIDETKGISNFAYPERAYNNAILLYESDVLQLKDHTVKIVNKDNKRITIINLLYSTQPHNAILIPAEEIKFDENWNKEDDGGYSTTKDNSIAEINKYFNQFWIIGNKTPKQGKMNIYYNDEYQLDINPPEIETIFDKEILFYELKNIKHNSYDLKIMKTSTDSNINTEESLHINYCYYLNEKSFTIPSETIVIEVNGMIDQASGAWTIINNDLYSDQEGSAIIVNLFSHKFWITGALDPNYGTVDISIDDKIKSSVSLYHENHEENIVFYESPDELTYKEHFIKLTNKDNNPIKIGQINYKYIPPTFIFSQSQYFTDSFFFSESKDFSGTYAFSKSEDFSRTHAFSKSNIFSKSNDFSKSGIFTETIAFSKSDVFSKSSFFTKSSDFSNSAIFSKTNYFTKTNKFSGTTDFTNTNCFTRSNDFTKSNNFMDSNLFTNSQYFSATTKFTKSDLLTESNHFTKSNSFVSSDIFTKSNDFSKSNSFSTSNYFSKTNHFSGTSYFSTTDDFTKSTSFTDSNLFSSSRSFSKSSDFSSTKHFSHTNLFSNTEHFTVTNHFTKTNDFTNSCFMQSASFSGTNKFSRSQKFTNTNDFSNSNYFSRSNEFSQSEPLPPIDDIGETCVVESSAKNYTLNRKCEFTSVNDINYLIHITRSNFTDFIEERNGGAIYIINGGVNCSNISFINCSSSSGCGGGVYIKNRLDLNYNISFRYSFFTLCKAFYGGAAYIYSYSEMNQIEIYACYFLKNYALGQKAKEKNLFGGAHVFITSRLLNITISKFERGIGEGGALKIYNKFDDDDEKSLRKLDEIHDSIWISGCKFDLAKGSKSSLSFEDDKELSTINVFDCDFTGKLSKGSHYIDGKISIKDDSKQIISSNKFEYENDDAVNLETVEKDQSVAPKYSHSNSKHLLMIVSCVSILAIVFIAFIIKTTNPEYDFNDESN